MTNSLFNDSSDLRTLPPLFWLFLNPEDGKLDQIEIFTADRASKITRHVRGKNVYRRCLWLFRKILVFHRVSKVYHHEIKY
jgi:hypothetical protein